MKCCSVVSSKCNQNILPRNPSRAFLIKLSKPKGKTVTYLYPALGSFYCKRFDKKYWHPSNAY